MFYLVVISGLLRRSIPDDFFSSPECGPVDALTFMFTRSTRCQRSLLANTSLAMPIDSYVAALRYGGLSGMLVNWPVIPR